MWQSPASTAFTEAGALACRSFATRGGLQEAAKAAGVRGAALNNLMTLSQARYKMYRPGGPIARMLARNPTILVVNDTLFAHGGVLPSHGAPRPFPPLRPGLNLPRPCPACYGHLLMVHHTVCTSGLGMRGLTTLCSLNHA